MDFQQVKVAVQRQFNKLKNEDLFRARVDRDKLWELYLKSFPEGTNPLFRERTEHDCSCCKAFVKSIGDLVAIVDGKLVSIWDCSAGEYQPVVDALAAYVKSCPIDNIYLSSISIVGTDKNYENAEATLEGRKNLLTWEHFYIQLPTTLVVEGAEIGPKRSECQAQHDVLLRSLKEISMEAVEIVQDLIAQNSLYRGAEKKSLVDTFAQMKKEFSALKTDEARDLYAWSHIRGGTSFASKIRNDVIGTLLVDLSEGEDLEDAVKSFEDKVSGTNYKRPTTLITPKMRDAAKAQLEKLGLIPSLERRFAVLEDIKITDVIFANRSAKKKMSGDVFDDIPVKGGDVKNLDKIEEISIADFIEKVVPRAQSLEVLFENKHASHLVSLTAPCDLTAPSLFKWNNPFAWAYRGDVADSVKERVKKAGGVVTGDLCCRLAWGNEDDLDFHMREPDYEIYYGNRRKLSPNGGVLDVDANGVDGIRQDPCENIVYVDSRKMRDGLYKLSVRQFRRRSTKNGGFEVEIELNGTVHNFSRFTSPQRDREDVVIANFSVAKGKITLHPILEATPVTKEIWGLKTNDFYPVQAFLLSPNCWDGREMGNKHYFFMLDGCKNDGQVRGFFNEFLKAELEPHRKAMEVVGSRLQVDKADNQLSGVGFSSTQRNTVACRVRGTFNRTLRVVI